MPRSRNDIAERMQAAQRRLGEVRRELKELDKVGYSAYAAELRDRRDEIKAEIRKLKKEDRRAEALENRCRRRIYHDTLGLDAGQCSRRGGHGKDGRLCRQHAAQEARELEAREKMAAGRG